MVVMLGPLCGSGCASTAPLLPIQSDGFSFRVANLTGCAVAAIVTNPGSGYVAGTTTVTPSAGNSVWSAIVGGQLTSISVPTAGSSYGIPPEVVIDAPPTGGVPATAIAAISSGSVTSITLLNQGAGYSTTPNVTLVPNQADPNLGTITNATGLATVGGAGKVTAVLCTNPGAAVASTMTLTIAGSGSSAAATPVFMNAVTGASIVSVGAGYSNTVTELTTLGGVSAATATFTNPIVEPTGFDPRPLRAALAVSGGTITSVSTIYDGGVFLGTPLPLVVTNGIVTTVASITLTLGGVNDTVRFQSL